MRFKTRDQVSLFTAQPKAPALSAIHQPAGAFGWAVNELAGSRRMMLIPPANDYRVGGVLMVFTVRMSLPSELMLIEHIAELPAA